MAYRGGLAGPPFYIPSVYVEGGYFVKRERFEQRLFRIFATAGYSPVQLLTITPEEMVEVPGVTVPNIRAVLCVQNKVISEENLSRKAAFLDEFL